MQENQRVVSLDDIEPTYVDGKDEGGALTYDEVMAVIMSLENKLDREVLILYKMQDRPVAEVAGMLNMSVNGVYTRCSRALATLRERLKEVMGND
ncbi:MAG: hypothetical protein EOL87_07555 [Spartobacteria bacterium]|nr:hypothetical protein [Spartobacteria bacterium]